MTKRYVAQFIKGGFPEQYAVADTSTQPWTRVSEPKDYHLANLEAARLNGETIPDDNLMIGWLGGLNFTPIKG